MKMKMKKRMKKRMKKIMMTNKKRGQKMKKSETMNE